MRTALRGRSARAEASTGPPALERSDIGGVLLIQPRDSHDGLAVEFAGGLTPDPHHTQAVLDLPARVTRETWKAAARLLRRQGHSFRIVLGRHEGVESLAGLQQLADLLRREILAPDAPVGAAAGGWLWIPEDRGSGWLRFTPGMVPRLVSRRFPEPAWEPGLRDTTWQPAQGATAEPLPAGVWLRPQHENDPGRHRHRLTTELAARTDRLTVVIGSPMGGSLPTAAITGWWAALPPATRRAVRFVQYGPSEIANDFGQGLADLLGSPVTLCTGLPERTGAATDVRVHTVLPEGTRGWRPFAQDVEYSPRPRRGGPSTQPRIVSHRRPVPDLPEITEDVYKQTYRYAPGAVLEVVRSGLWLRPPYDPPDADLVRRAPTAPAHAVIWHDTTVSATADEMRTLAWQVRERLGTATAQDCRVLPSHRAPRPSPGPSASQAADHPPAPRPGRSVAPSRETEQVPDTSIPPGRQPHWTAHPGVRRLLTGGSVGGPASTLSDAVARRLASELRKLPRFEGPVVVRVQSDTPVALGLYQPHRLVTEWGFWPASTNLREIDAPLDTDGESRGPVTFVVWSVNARATRALEPNAPDRVVFLPGTAFRVLPAPDVPSAVVLLREVPPSEAVSEDGGTTAQLDKDALDGLKQAVTDMPWARSSRRTA
ncbi:hypothetical protein EES40_36205 [Streptomyces sp. ADI93-02]|nr:hypothetical protein EES40_36205 [Streptomyces sp. ADI93-02]